MEADYTPQFTSRTLSAHRSTTKRASTLPLAAKVFRAPTFRAWAIRALACGALALGALAIGRLAVGFLAIGKSRIRRLEIDELDVRRLRVIDLEVVGAPVTPTHRTTRTRMDTDLDQMTREQLIAEVQKLRQGIREHRDSSRHELCWHHPSLWGLLPEKTDPLPVVPEWPEFMRGCIKYRQSLDEQAPNAPRTNEPYVK